MKNLFNTTAAQLSENISIISTGQVDNAKVGDVDGDGYITALDSQLVALYVSKNIQQGTEVQIGSKRITIEQENIDRMDANSDEQVDINDVTAILDIYKNAEQVQEVKNNTETFELVSLEYSNGFAKIENGEITWEITNEEGTASDIATIDGEGNFKKVKDGTGYIKATYNEESTQLKIKIGKIMTDTISIISTGKVDDAKVGDVDGDGYITALDSQLVALYVSKNIQQGTEVQIGSKRVTIEQENIDRMDANSDEQVDINDVTAILDIYKNTEQVQEVKNNTETFELVSLEYNSGFAKIDNGEITWEITNEEGTESDIATIDGQGNFKKVKEGTGYIKATYNEESTQLKIKIGKIMTDTISIISTGKVADAKVGDVDGDGYITALDSQLVALYVSKNIQQGTEVQIGSKRITIEQENIDRMDANSDEQVDINDVTAILDIYKNTEQVQEVKNNTETFELVSLEYNSGFAKIENGEITWEITNEEGTASDIATIDGEGNFKKVKEGTGYIKATHNGENTQLLIGIKDIKYSIKYDANQGIFSDDTSDKIYEINSENGYITLPEDVPTRKGYIFKGYSKNKSYNTEDELFQPGNSYQGEDFNISETTTLYACWTEEVYSITYNLDGGTVIENPNNYTIESETITLNNPTKEGYIFIGWTGSNGAVPEKTVTIPKGTTGNKQYTANWNKEVEEDLISSDKYEINQENKTIKIPSETSVDEFLSNVTIKGTKTVIIKNEKEIIGNEYIGTESTITIYEDEKDTKGITYTFEVIGDVTGDGRMNITDVLKLRAHIVKTIELKGYYKIMADVNEDNDINSTDVMLLRKLITERQ